MKRSIIGAIICCMFCVATSFGKARMSVEELRQVQIVIEENSNALNQSIDKISTFESANAISNLSRVCSSLKISGYTELVDLGGKCEAEFQRYNDNYLSVLDICYAPADQTKTKLSSQTTTYDIRDDTYLYSEEAILSDSFGYTYSAPYELEILTFESLALDDSCDRARKRAEDAKKDMEICLTQNGIWGKIGEVLGGLLCKLSGVKC